MQNISSWARLRWRGFLTALVIAVACMFVSNNYGGPSVLYALLVGMAFHFLTEDSTVMPGIEMCAKTLLRIGVALLGVRITAEELAHLSPATLCIIIGGVFATVAFSMFLNRFLKWPRAEGALAGASVAICGASAAAALALVIDKKDLREQALLAIIVIVTALSTVAMVLYPMVLDLTGFMGSTAGLILGGTIHDVAQVVGAGSMLGQDALETATMTKMLRVAMLVPMIVVFATLFSPKAEHTTQKVNPIKQIPLFLVGFVALAALSVLGVIPQAIADRTAQLSQLCILIAIAALGIKTSLGKLRTVGWTPIILMSADTLFLFCWVYLGILIAR